MPPVKRYTMEEAQAAVREWNLHYPSGTIVEVLRDNDQIEITHTRTPAWCVGSGAPVVSVVGISGGYALDRVSPLKFAHQLAPCIRVMELLWNKVYLPPAFPRLLREHFAKFFTPDPEQGAFLLVPTVQCVAMLYAARVMPLTTDDVLAFIEEIS